MSTNLKSHHYNRAKENSQYILEVITKLEQLKILEDQSLLKSELLLNEFEVSELVDIKNTISNIYLLLNLHEVEGISDQIFNANFKPL